jgi:chromosome segregation ATPase
VRQLVIRWNGATIYDGPGVSNGQPVVVSGFSYYPSTYRSGSLYGWHNDHNNAFDIYRKSSVSEKAIADCKAAAESAEVAKKALAATNGNYKGLFAQMMKHVKSDMNSMKTDVESEFKAITSKRDSVAAVLADQTAMAKEKEKNYNDAISALRAADQQCTSTTNTATATAATLRAVTASLNSRNPVIEKELRVIRQLVAKVGELKSINLQESSSHEDARSSAYQQTRDMIESLQSFGDEAAPLSEMIEMAREHAEFTQPILKLLQELEAKLIAEQNSLLAEVSSADKANTLAQASASSSCQQKAAKKVEECVFFCEFAHVIF